MTDTHADARLKAALKSQYHAALAMLRESIERCPDALWYSHTPTNAFWQVAYHTLFFAHLVPDADGGGLPAVGGTSARRAAS